MPVTALRGRFTPVPGQNTARIPAISGHIWVPVDDVTTSIMNFTYAADPNIPFDEQFLQEAEANYGRAPEDLTPDMRLKLNWGNDFKIDRSVQKTQSFTGIAGINTQDFAVQEGMGGIVDRSEEHLGATDRAIVTMRRLLLEAVKTVEAGGKPRGIDTASCRALRAIDHYAESEVEIPQLIERELAARF
jgi:hypothetical protein